MSGFAEIACQTDPDFTGKPFNNFFSGIIQKDGICEAFTQVDSVVKNETFPDTSALIEIDSTLRKKRKKSQQRASIYNQSLQILMTALKNPNTPEQQQQVITILEQNPSLMVRLARGQANQQQQGWQGQGQPGGPQGPQNHHGQLGMSSSQPTGTRRARARSTRWAPASAASTTSTNGATEYSTAAATAIPTGSVSATPSALDILKEGI